MKSVYRGQSPAIDRDTSTSDAGQLIVRPLSRRALIERALLALSPTVLTACNGDSPDPVSEPLGGRGEAPPSSSPVPSPGGPTPSPAPAPAPAPAPTPPPPEPEPLPVPPPVPSDFPAWRARMSAFTWTAVGTSVLADVDPARDPGLNPQTDGRSPWRGSDGQKALIDAWGSAVWDEVRRDLWVPLGGGHGNYAGNEPYKIGLGTDTPRWRMLRPPSGANGNLIALDDGKDSTGVYADGRPRSAHIYNNVAFATGVGPVIVRVASTYPMSSVSHKVFKVDRETGEPTLVFDFSDAASVGLPDGFPSGTNIGGLFNGASCYDNRRNRICSVGIGNNAHFMFCIPSAEPGMWRGGRLPRTVYLSEGPQGLVYLPVQDRYMSISVGPGVMNVTLVHPTTGEMRRQSVSGSFVAGMELATMPGAVWAPELNRVLLWNQASNTATVTALAPIGDGLSQWALEQLPLSGGNTVEPPVRAQNGTFGLFGYSQSLRGCYLITSTTAPVHFFATQ